MLTCVPSGRKALKNPSPNVLRPSLRSGGRRRGPSPVAVCLRGLRRANSSPWVQTSASTIGPSRCGRCSPVSPRGSATRRRRSRCSGEPAADHMEGTEEQACFRSKGRWVWTTDYCFRTTDYGFKTTNRFWIIDYLFNVIIYWCRTIDYWFMTEISNLGLQVLLV